MSTSPISLAIVCVWERWKSCYNVTRCPQLPYLRLLFVFGSCGHLVTLSQDVHSSHISGYCLYFGAVDILLQCDKMSTAPISLAIACVWERWKSCYNVTRCPQLPYLRLLFVFGSCGHLVTLSQDVHSSHISGYCLYFGAVDILLQCDKMSTAPISLAIVCVWELWTSCYNVTRCRTSRLLEESNNVLIVCNVEQVGYWKNQIMYWLFVM